MNSGFYHYIILHLRSVFFQSLRKSSSLMQSSKRMINKISAPRLRVMPIFYAFTQPRPEYVEECRHGADRLTAASNLNSLYIRKGDRI